MMLAKLSGVPRPDAIHRDACYSESVPKFT